MNWESVYFQMFLVPWTLFEIAHGVVLFEVDSCVAWRAQAPDHEPLVLVLQVLTRPYNGSKSREPCNCGWCRWLGCHRVQSRCVTPPTESQTVVRATARVDQGSSCITSKPSIVFSTRSLRIGT